MSISARQQEILDFIGQYVECRGYPPSIRDIAKGCGMSSSSVAVMAVQQNDSTDSIRMLQEWLGHANIGTTMRYRKVAGQELKGWYEKLWPRKEGSNG